MLYKKMLRDISNYKIQFISIFLMAFLAVFIFTGVSSEAIFLEDNINAYYDETNLADAWIYANNIDDEFVDIVSDLGPTTQTERQLVLSSIADFNTNPEIKLHFIEDNEISKFYLVEGEKFDLDDEDGVWLDKSFADNKSLEIGDNITFKFNGMEVEKEIKGLVYSPEYVYSLPYYAVKPVHGTYGFAYMSYKAFPMDDVPYNVLNVKFNGSAEDYKYLLDDELEDAYNSFLLREEHSSVSAYQHMITQLRMIANALPIVFIFISMLMLVTSMKRIITHQRTQIGILKANGFKNRTLMIHYISYSLLVLAGSLLGLILGPIVIHKMAYPPLAKLFIVPYFSSVGIMGFAYVILLMVILSAIVSYFSIRNIVNEDPSTIIRPKAPKATTSSFIERLRFWKHMSFNFRWNYRDAKRHNFRAITTIVGVMACTMLLIYAFGLYDGMTDSEHWEFDKINHFENKLVVDEDANLSDVNKVADMVDGDKIMESAIEIESDSSKKTGSLLVLNGTDLITPTDIHQNRIKIKDDEVAISQKMANLLGVGVGDTVKWHIMGSDKWVDVKIDKIYGHPSSQGFIMSSKKLEDLDINYTTTGIITKNDVRREYDGVKSIITREEMLDSLHELNRSLWVMVYALMVFAVVLAIIVLYNLGLLSFLEMERDIGTLKVLGFKTRALTKLLLTQSLAFIIIGGLIGIPLGYYVLDMVWKSSSEKTFTLPSISAMNLICTFAIILAVSIGINIYFAYKIRNLDMVDALKILE